MWHSAILRRKTNSKLRLFFSIPVALCLFGVMAPEAFAASSSGADAELTVEGFPTLVRPPGRTVE